MMYFVTDHFNLYYPDLIAHLQVQALHLLLCFTVWDMQVHCTSHITNEW